MSLPDLSCSLCRMKHAVFSCSAVAMVPTMVLGVGQKVTPSFLQCSLSLVTIYGNHLVSAGMRLAQERIATAFDVDSHSR